MTRVSRLDSWIIMAAILTGEDKQLGQGSELALDGVSGVLSGRQGGIQGKLLHLTRGQCCSTGDLTCKDWAFSLP